MLYFIPGWYRKNHWSENEQLWYKRRTHTEFDDSVKQVQLFNRNKVAPFRIILLSYAPNFRHFLHRQGAYHVDYWSFFDCICGIKKKKPTVFSFHDLNWPEGIEFIYSQFAVLAFLNGEKYAQIEFAEDGNPIVIDMFQKDRIIRSNMYDDRGFVSSTILYKDGKPDYQEYLTEGGVWKIRAFFGDKHIEINPLSNSYTIDKDGNDKAYIFEKTVYENIEQVIKEVLGRYVESCKDNDIFCIAMHNIHSKLLDEVLSGRKKILSFYGDRYAFDTQMSIEVVKNADHIITDSYETSKTVIENVPQSEGIITDITPYDARPDFGNSHQLMVQKILIPVDGLEDDVFDRLIRTLGSYLPENENARVHLFTRRADYDIEGRLLKKTAKILLEAGCPPEWAYKKESMDDTGAENALIDAEEDEEEAIEERFFVEQCVDELSVTRCMKEQRIIVDIRSVPELYLQITAISGGIPQIVRYKTQYLEEGKNGFAISSMDELGEKLDYYLGSMANWNKCLIYCNEIIKKYTTRVLVGKWREVIENLEQC